MVHIAILCIGINSKISTAIHPSMTTGRWGADLAEIWPELRKRYRRLDCHPDSDWFRSCGAETWCHARTLAFDQPIWTHDFSLKSPSQLLPTTQ